MDVLYNIPADTKELIIPEGSEINKILIFVEKNKFGDSESNTLHLIIKAIKLDLQRDITIIKMEPTQKISLSSVSSDFQDIILFGLQPSTLGFFVEFKYYEVMKFEKHRMLLADTLTELNNSKTKKAQLWSVLQSMYIV